MNQLIKQICKTKDSVGKVAKKFIVQSFHRYTQSFYNQQKIVCHRSFHLESFHLNLTLLVLHSAPSLLRWWDSNMVGANKHSVTHHTCITSDFIGYAHNHASRCWRVATCERNFHQLNCNPNENNIRQMLNKLACQKHRTEHSFIRRNSFQNFVLNPFKQSLDPVDAFGGLVYLYTYWLRQLAHRFRKNLKKIIKIINVYKHYLSSALHIKVKNN